MIWPCSSIELVINSPGIVSGSITQDDSGPLESDRPNLRTGDRVHLPSSKHCDVHANAVPVQKEHGIWRQLQQSLGVFSLFQNVFHSYSISFMPFWPSPMRRLHCLCACAGSWILVWRWRSWRGNSRGWKVSCFLYASLKGSTPNFPWGRKELVTARWWHTVMACLS